MSKRIYLTLALCLACLSALVACGAGDGNSNSNTANNANGASNANRAASTPATAATAATPAASTSAAAGDKIGVAECDDYLAKVDACVSGKVPEAARAQFRSGIDQTRASWRTLAANPQTRGSLAAACKTATESARATYKAYDCEF